ncbi:DoxX family protein [Halalkalibaculum sp. DA3122]|uniref:DoxX family protein n=1 Tax=unclassified Halalkalibaculum TaxID=2964617 RepID=UPI003754B3BE
MLKRLKSSKLSEFVDIGISLLILRVVASFAMIYGHGWGKLMNVFSGNFQFADPIGLGPTISLILAAFAEAICAFLVMIGYYTRAAALVLVINMTVAFLFVHLFNDPFSGMEKAVLFLTIYLTIFLTGPGKYSLDSE